MSTQRCDPAVDLPRHPFPGDLFIDTGVPAAERVTVGQGPWRAEATHVWTGTGWTRLVVGAVRPVPSAGPAHQRPVLLDLPVMDVPVIEPDRDVALDVEGAPRSEHAAVLELRPLAPSARASRARRSRYAAHEHRWAS